MRVLTRARAVAGVVAVVLVLAGCGGGGGDDGAGSADGEEASSGATSTIRPGSSTTGPADTSTTMTVPQTPEQAAIAAYNEGWEESFRTLNPPQVTPELRELFTGEALSQILLGISTRERQGIHLEGTAETHPVPVSVSPTEIVLNDCVVEDSTEYDSDGNVVDPGGPVNYNFEVVMVLEDALWKAADFNLREEPCEPQ